MAPVGGSEETVMNLAVPDTKCYDLIHEGTVKVNGRRDFREEVFIW